MAGTTSATVMANVDPSAQDLPFLVVHGERLWIAVVAIAVIAVAAAIWRSRRRSARLGALRAAADLERSPGGDAIVRGTLGGDAPGPAGRLATLRAVRRSTEEEVAVTRSTGALWIDTGAGRVALDGNLRVIAGSRAIAARHGVPAEVTDAHLDDAREHAPWLHRGNLFGFASVSWARLDTLSPGDSVVARGRLETVPSGAPTSYRDSEATSILRTPETGAIELAARTPRAAAPRLAYDVLALVLASTAVLSWGVMRAVGASALRPCREAAERATFADAAQPLALGGTHACAIAAGMPGTRGEALDALLRALERDPYRDERTLARLAGAAQLVRGCGPMAEVFLDAGRLEDAERHARACGDRRIEYIALVSQGRFEDAAALGMPAPDHRDDRLQRPPADALIAAGRWGEAALAADAQAEALLLDRIRPGASYARYFRCLAELFRGYNGGADTANRLRQLDLEEPGLCWPMIAALDEWSYAQQEVDPTPPYSHGQYGKAPGLVAYSWDQGAAEYMLLDPDEAPREVGLAWLAAADRRYDRPDFPALHRAGHLRWIAVGQALDGDLAAAGASAREALSLTLPETPFRVLPFLPALIGLYTPERELPTPPLDESDAADPEARFSRLRMRRGKPTYQRAEAPYRAALDQAVQGRGDALAAQIRNREWKEGDAIAVLPRLESGREAVARQIRWSSSMRYGGARAGVFQLALHAFQRRELMKLAGQPDEAARWGAIYRRFDAALEDRRVARALMLWAAAPMHAQNPPPPAPRAGMREPRGGCTGI